MLFDQNNDGFICEKDLRATFKTMGMEVDEKLIAEMMADASQPINFESFALMMVYKTMELEPEIVLLEVAIIILLIFKLLKFISR